MATNRSILWRVVPAAFAGLFVAQALEDGAPTVRAESVRALLDSDGDLLPDALEWTLLLDPQKADTNGDGIDDFLSAVQHRLPLSDRTNYSTDHEMRVAASSLVAPDGQREVWVSMMFRFLGAGITQVSSFSPYLDWWGYRVPLDRLLGQSPMYMTQRHHPTEGLYLLIAFRVASEKVLAHYLPCTIGAVAVIGGRTINTGTYLRMTDGAVTSLVPVSETEAVIQTLLQDDGDNPFWRAARVCFMQLALVGTSPQGSFLEVTQANCVSDGQLSCPPNCASSVGQILFFPDGLRTVTGGRGSRY